MRATLYFIFILSVIVMGTDSKRSEKKGDGDSREVKGNKIEKHLEHRSRTTISSVLNATTTLPRLNSSSKVTIKLKKKPKSHLWKKQRAHKKKKILKTTPRTNNTTTASSLTGNRTLVTIWSSVGTNLTTLNNNLTSPPTSPAPPNSSTDGVSTTNNGTTGDVSTTKNATTGGVSTTNNATTGDVSTTNNATTGDVSTTNNATTGDVSTTNNATAGDVSTTNNPTTGGVSTTNNATTGDVSTTNNATTGGVGTTNNATTGSVGTTNNVTTGGVATTNNATTAGVGTTNNATKKICSTQRPKTAKTSARTRKSYVTKRDNRTMRTPPWHKRWYASKVLSNRSANATYLPPSTNLTLTRNDTWTLSTRPLIRLNSFNSTLFAARDSDIGSSSSSTVHPEPFNNLNSPPGQQTFVEQYSAASNYVLPTLPAIVATIAPIRPLLSQVATFVANGNVSIPNLVVSNATQPSALEG